MAKQICTKCGFEGRGIALVGDVRRGGGTTRVLGILLLLPIHTLWKLGGKKEGKQCPHCGLPTMVKLNSDAGRLARHMLDVEIGAISVKISEEVVAFGNERPVEKIETKKPVNPEQW
jgi:hypothetical protein